MLGVHSDRSRDPSADSQKMKNFGTRFSFTEVLAALILASIPFGPLFKASVGGKTMSLTASQTLVVILILHLLISLAAGKTPQAPGLRWPIGRMAAVAGLMMFPVLIAPDVAAAGQAYVNFALGTVGGLAVGYLWCMTPVNRVGALEAGLTIFLVWATMQLLLAFAAAGEFMGFHQAAVTPWGGSNYVAGTMVVAAFALLGRLRRVGPISLFWALPAIAAIAVSLLTLSRGAILATSVAMATFLWTAAQTPTQRFLYRGTALIVPLLAWIGLQAATANRLSINSQATKNVEIRFDQYALAWNDFSESPLFGKGWVSFRETAYDALGNETSFVHNVFMSFLQMGGLLFGLPVLVLLIGAVFRSSRQEPLLAPAIFAALTIAMSDPFFESSAAALVTWSVIGRAARAQPMASHLAAFSRSSPTSLRAV